LISGWLAVNTVTEVCCLNIYVA